MAVIKRYSNRKLYDTENRRYISLQDVAESVCRGESVEVRDHATGVDLTTLTLLQVILENQKRTGMGLPLAGLRQIILQSGRSHLAALRANTSAFWGYQPFQEELQRRLDILVSRDLISQPEAARISETLLDPALDQESLEARIPDQPTSAEIHALIAQIERLSQTIDTLQK